MSPRIRTAVRAAGLAVALIVLSGCGSDDTSGTAQDPAEDPTSAESSPQSSPSASSTEATPTESPSASASESSGEAPETLPACSEVWVVGASVPGRYDGCLEGATTVPADGRYCEFGKPLFTYQKNFYAVAGGPVIATERPLLRDAGYRDALKKCGG